MIHTFDALVLGGGAAGLMCAIQAGRRGRSVAILERSERVGKKILISGGGRCNFTNLNCRPENFLSSNPHFCKSALARYTPSDFIATVERHRIPYHEKTLGQLFCDRSALDIVRMLEDECKGARIQTFLNTRIREVSHGSGFCVRTENDEFRSSALVVATGGLSIPKMGATGFGYELARQFGHKIQPCRPALVPLTFSMEDCRRYCDLAGLSTEVVTSIGHDQFQEKMLFTHRGLSGPAVLQISSYWKPSMPIVFDLAPGKKPTAELSENVSGRNLQAAKTAFRKTLPHRFADRWLELHSPPKWTNAALHDLENRVHHWEVMPAGTEGYEKAEVTAGGVDTSELFAKTMESKRVPGLYFVGEVVDVTGHLGGFNFQWAWASGFCAGQAL